MQLECSHSRSECGSVAVATPSTKTKLPDEGNLDLELLAQLRPTEKEDFKVE